MANDHTDIEVVGIRSNVDKLSERVIHDTFVDFIKDELIVGETALKALVPKREGDMETHAGHKGPYDEGLEITGSVGIPEIHKVGESDPLSAKYPIFTEGTGIFADRGTIFPKEKQFMYIPPERGIPGFLRTSKGQEGKHFMASTFSIMQAMLRINGEIFRARLTERLKADQIT